MMLVFVTLSTDVSRSVIMNLIIEGANCLGCIWCDLFEMCCYDERGRGTFLVKRNAKCNAYSIDVDNFLAWGPQGQSIRGLGRGNGLPIRRETFTQPK
jgi:hypothetical protein